MLTADHAESFAILCIRVHDDQLLWLRMAAGALRQAREEQTPEALAGDVGRILSSKAFAAEVERRRGTDWQRPPRVPMRKPPCVTQTRAVAEALPASPLAHGP